MGSRSMDAAESGESICSTCRSRPIPYYHAVDPISARRVLRLDPVSPVTAGAVEDAYAREVWERHPSRYSDAASREAATAWGATLAEARAILLQSMAATAVTDASASAVHAVPPHSASSAFVPPGPMMSAVATPAPMPSFTTASAREVEVAPKRRRRVGLVIVIVAASLAVLALFVAAGVGATKVALQLEGLASALDEPVQTYAPADVETYSADEMSFTFPAAMELYNDGRYSQQCPAEFTAGCWQAAVITEASCTSLQVDLEYSNDDGDDWTVQARETITVSDVVAGDITPIVFGHDGYNYGWIFDVRCVVDVATAEPATNANAVSTPLPRLEAGRWAFENTGFWFPASLEVYDDGRLGPCPPEVERGCWQAAIVPEASCERLTVQYSFTNGTTSQLRHAITRADVVPGEPVEVVFGHDSYEFGWISFVSCTS